MKKVAWLLWKDALAEARSLERVSTLALFAAAVLVTLSFSLEAGSAARPVVAAGFVWATIVFAALLELRSSVESERREGTLDGLRAAPLDPASLFAAKALSSALVLAVLAAALVSLASILFGTGASGIATAVGVALLGIVGLVAWGTLFATAAATSRAAEVVLPVLLFPLLVPQTIACVRLLSWSLAGSTSADPGTGFLLLGAFDVLALGTSLLLFVYVLDE